MTGYARCNCDECQRLDRLPLRRQGIPGAWQPNLLSGAMHTYIPHPQPSDAELDAQLAALAVEVAQHEHASLPLFAGGLEPSLF